MTRKGQHITAEQAIAIFKACPDAVLTRSGGWGFFDQATQRAARNMGIDATQLTFRTCEALVKRGVITLRSASRTAGYWIAFANESK